MSKFKPDGRRTVIPRIITDDVAGLVGFLKTVFGAGGEPQSATPTEMTMGDSVVMISDGGGAREAMPAFLYVYVQNADETYERAIAAGAESIEKPADMPYGDRRATVKDLWLGIPIESGRSFRRDAGRGTGRSRTAFQGEAGHHSDLKPDSVPT
jgi:PhnB protein